MTYQTLANFSETWGLVLLVLMFLSGIAFALWPSNKERFEEAARLPLEEDQEDQEDKP